MPTDRLKLQKLKVPATWVRKVKAAVRWLRFGEITSAVKGTAGDGFVAEIEYRGRGNRVIGYWAYGYFDPELPYQG